MAREDAQEPPLAFGELDGRAAAAQLLALEIEGACAEADIGDRREGRRGGDTGEDALDAEHELARLEGLGEVIVGAALEALDALLGLAHGREHEDGHLALEPECLGEVEAALPGHHHVEHDEIEGEALEPRPGLRGIGRDRDAEAAFGQVAAQQLAQALVVVDDQDVRRLCGHARLYPGWHRPVLSGEIPSPASRERGAWVLASAPGSAPGRAR